MLTFSKYHGSGNDFLLIEDFEQLFSPKSVTRLCHRTRGVGADGVILLQQSEMADFRMRIFNADGSEAEMCGNGLRCFVQFLVDLGHAKEEYRVETQSGVLTVNRRGGKISTHLGKPRLLFWEKVFYFDGKKLQGYGFDTGVPHAIFFEPLEDFVAFAKLVRVQEDANVSLLSVLAPNEIAIRTYERGVEGETLACGTGAAAAAVVAAKLFGWQGCIRVKPPSGDWLEVNLSAGLEVSGPAEKVYDGRIFS